MFRRVCLLLVGLAALSGLAAIPARRDLLWIALQGCRIADAVVGRPYPCLSIDGGDGIGTAVLAEPGNPKHVLVVPTRTVVGIEAPELRHEAGAAYWKAALAARHAVVRAVAGRVALEDVGMAVNSLGGRSQDQLHIHLSCLEPAVRTALRASGPEIGGSWHRLAVPLEDVHFDAMRIVSEDVNPFAALATLPGTRSDLPGSNLRDASMAVIGAGEADASGGFYLLAYRAPRSYAERLLDHTCAIARKAPRDRREVRARPAGTVRP